MSEIYCWMRIWGWPMEIDLYVVPHYALRHQFKVRVNDVKMEYKQGV